MKLRVEPYQWIIKCITLYSLSTIIYGIVNDYLPLNTILGIILIILFGILYLKNLKKRDIYFFICVLFLFVFDNLVAIDKAASISDSVYWVFTLLAIWKVCDEETYKCLYMAIVKQSDFIKIIFTINNFILVGGLFLGNCYSKSWGSTYYVGFAYSNHVLASGACITLVMALYIFNDIKSIFLRVLILLPATIAILQSGARTYIVSIAVIWLIYFLYCFQKVNIKLFFIPFATIVISYIFINSGMMQSSMAYYAAYSLENPDMTGMLGMCSTIPLVIGIPFMPKLIDKMGMRKANVCGTFISLLGCLIAVLGQFLGGITIIIAGLLIKAAGTVPGSTTYTPFMVKADEYHYQKMGHRVTGSLFSCATVGTKVGQGLGTAICGWVLTWGGFDGTAAVQSVAATNAINFLYLGFPVIFTIITAFLYSQMKVEDEIKQ